MRLRAALTHASARKGDAADYQRLEFLGDPGAWPRGRRNDLRRLPAGTRRRNCPCGSMRWSMPRRWPRIADEAGMPDLIPHQRRGSRGAPAATRSICAPTWMEALIAVLYTRRRHGRRADLHQALLGTAVEAGRVPPAATPRRRCRNGAHQISGASPLYSVDNRSGPDHDPVFTVSVKVGEMPAATRPGAFEARGRAGRRRRPLETREGLEGSRR